MIKHLAESETYKIYARCESVYRKRKALGTVEAGYAPDDQCIAVHYGDPTSALITPLDRHIIVSGCGISIYSTEHEHDEHLLADTPDTRWWTDAPHQTMSDDKTCTFRFVSLNEANQLRVFRMNLLTRQVEQLD